VIAQRRVAVNNLLSSILDQIVQLNRNFDDDNNNNINVSQLAAVKKTAASATRFEQSSDLGEDEID